MSPEEQKLLFILQKEDSLIPFNCELCTIEVPENLINSYLNLMDDKNLCKYFRNMIILEEYETVAFIKKEINRRGYNIVFKEKSVLFTQKPDQQ